MYNHFKSIPKACLVVNKHLISLTVSRAGEMPRLVIKALITFASLHWLILDEINISNDFEFIRASCNHLILTRNVLHDRTTNFL